MVFFDSSCPSTESTPVPPFARPGPSYLALEAGITNGFDASAVTRSNEQNSVTLAGVRANPLDTFGR
jgi:hypothetical protein